MHSNFRDVKMWKYKVTWYSSLIGMTFPALMVHKLIIHPKINFVLDFFKYDN